MMKTHVFENCPMNSSKKNALQINYLIIDPGRKKIMRNELSEYIRFCERYYGCFGSGITHFTEIIDGALIFGNSLN